MSLITTPPTGRRPVAGQVGEYDPEVGRAASRVEMGRGGQVYYVSNRVKTIDDAVERGLEVAPAARLGVAHGKMSPREVEDVMVQFATQKIDVHIATTNVESGNDNTSARGCDGAVRHQEDRCAHRHHHRGERNRQLEREHPLMVQFATKKIDVLIATTIVESGIDNSSANTLIIEDSQRLGLAQLSQLQGRVGRSATQAYAYFMFPGELPLTEEATARLTALSEFQDLGSGMRIAMRDLEIRGAGSLIAMRDLEIRGAGSLVGAEQHGNLSSVGFDLFTQMLGAAVAEARGEGGADVEQAGVAINLPADFFLAEEYVPAVDRRVLVYRKLAAADMLEQVDALQLECEETFGALPEAAQNLFDRTRIRIRADRLGLESVSLIAGKLTYQGVRADRLGLESVSLIAGKLTYQGVDVPKDVAFELRTKLGAIAFPKTRKFTVPYKVGAGNGSGIGRGINADVSHGGIGPVQAALDLLIQLGPSGDDD